MSDLSMQLPERLSRLGETGLLIPLLRLLADGDPVTVQQLSVAAGRTIDEVRLGLAAMQDTEYDDQGRIVGQGLTLRPTPHRFTVDGEELYTWCALDTLIFPALLDRPARGVRLPGQRRDDPRHHRSGCRCHRRHTPERRGVAGEPGADHLDPLGLLQPGALFRLRRRRHRVAL